MIIPITKYFLGNEKIKNKTSVRIQEQNIIEIEITITSNFTKLHVLKRDFYFHQSIDEFVGNMSNNDIGIKWFFNEQILRFIADGKID